MSPQGANIDAGHAGGGDGLQPQISILVGDTFFGSNPDEARSSQENVRVRLLASHVFTSDQVIEEMVDFLRAKARHLDPKKQGVSFVIQSGFGPDVEHLADKRITLSMMNASLATIVKEVAKQVGMEARFDPLAIIFTPAKKNKLGY